MTKHGDAPKHGKHTPEHTAWVAMIQRCTNPKSASYVHYGARGISVCQRWRDSYENFLADMGRRPTGGYSIERINNDLGYTPDNCKWATKTEQARNRRAVRSVLRSDGVIYRTIVEAAESVGVHPTGVSAVCRGLQSTAGGYGWAFLRARLAMERKDA